MKNLFFIALLSVISFNCQKEPGSENNPAGPTTALPIITTTGVSSITSTTAAGGGTISSDGGAAVTTRGVCWNTAPNPVVTGNHSTDGNGTGTFISAITGLTASTTYYARAYATNSVGTAYGTEISFTTTNTALALTTLTTTAISSITTTTASGGGNISTDGGATVTARGICWSTAPNPGIALSTKTSDGTGAGTFSSSITGLAPNTNYYVRAYATNSVGTAYGNQQTFTTLPASNTITDIDGNIYPVITICNQVWVQKNLNVSRYSNGDPIPNVTDNLQWATLTTGAWCWYNNDSATYAAVYGKLYNWYAVNDPRGLAPAGWHIPSESDWNKLEKCVDPLADTTCPIFTCY